MQNRLLGYHEQRQNKIYNHNPLLSRKTNDYHSNLQKQNEAYQLRQIEKVVEMEQDLDIDKIRELVIKPLNVTPDRFEHSEIKKKYSELEKNYEPSRNTYWKQRTNQPYKNIIKDRAHIDKFIGKSQINKEELIIHRVSKEDKKGVEEKFNKLGQTIKTHDKELNVLYSTSNETEHKKKFEYNHKYKYRQSYNPTDHNEMKQDRIEQFKKDQMKSEADKEKIENILEVLLDDGNLEDEEIKGMSKPVKTNITPIKTNVTPIKPNIVEIATTEIISRPKKNNATKTNITKINSNSKIKNIVPMKIDAKMAESNQPKTQITKLNKKSKPVIIRKK